MAARAKAAASSSKSSNSNGTGNPVVARRRHAPIPTPVATTDRLAGVAPSKSVTCEECFASIDSAVNAASRCSRCKAVSYCNAECQRRHWPLHKLDCVRAQPSSSLPVDTSTLDAVMLADGVAKMSTTERGAGGLLGSVKTIDRAVFRDARSRRSRIVDALRLFSARHQDTARGLEKQHGRGALMVPYEFIDVLLEEDDLFAGRALDDDKATKPERVKIDARFVFARFMSLELVHCDAASRQRLLDAVNDPDRGDEHAVVFIVDQQATASSSHAPNSNGAAARRNHEAHFLMCEYADKDMLGHPGLPNKFR